MTRHDLNGLLCALVLGGVTLGALAAAPPGPPGASARETREAPVQRCLVSGEHLNAGEAVTYVYHEAGKPDRTIRLCCRKCLTRFKSDPERYLQKLPAPESPAPAAPAPATAPAGAGH